MFLIHSRTSLSIFSPFYFLTYLMVFGCPAILLGYMSFKANFEMDDNFKHFEGGETSVNLFIHEFFLVFRFLSLALVLL